MVRSRRAVHAVLAVALLAAAGAGAALAWLRAPALMTVETPASDAARVGIGGVEVLVRFDRDGRAEPATFRALLNGADVTGQLEVADNGAHGHLHGLLDGPNELRLEIFGRGLRLPGLPGPPLWLEETRRRIVVYRPPIDLDRG